MEWDYRGRFAPSPTGPLHAGSLVAALASWLDARAHDGIWLVRMEDVDSSRCVPGADEVILAQLAACGLVSDEPVVWQSRRGALYQQALDRLLAAGLAYPCGCTRREIETAWLSQGQARERHHERVYPGTCRAGLRGGVPRAWRLRTDIFKENRPVSSASWSFHASNSGLSCQGEDLVETPSPLRWIDRRLGPRQQWVERAVGDFVLKRADGLWAYQLAVVVDDGEQGITDIVRGEDLADNTPRQILLQQDLGLRTPRYLHVPLVRSASGEKLSKQQGAPALDTRDPLTALNDAATVLGLPPRSRTLGEALAAWVALWRERWGLESPAAARGAVDRRA